MSLFSSTRQVVMTFYCWTSDTNFGVISVGYVSGAGSGIGRATSLQLVEDGLDKLVLVDISAAGLNETAALIKQRNALAETLLLAVNVSHQEDFERVFQRAVDHFGKIDHCVNCAGIVGKMAAIDQLETPELDQVLNINLKATWWAERAQIRQFLKQQLRPVNIVNISSIVGLVGTAKYNPYVMSKHAVIGLTKSDAIDYAEQGIRVNAVCPGFVATSILPPSSLSTVRQNATEPMKRLASPEEIAYAISFLLSDRASYMTGASICVDGGFTAV